MTAFFRHEKQVSRRSVHGLRTRANKPRRLFRVKRSGINGIILRLAAANTARPIERFRGIRGIRGKFFRHDFHARLTSETHRSIFLVQLYIMEYMKQLLIELEDDLAAKLERVAPGRARKRSEFIRKAISRALWEIEEEATAEAYRRRPDSAADAYLDLRAWDPPHSRKRSRR